MASKGSKANVPSFTDKHVNAFIGNGHLDSQPPYVLVCAIALFCEAQLHGFII